MTSFDKLESLNIYLEVFLKILEIEDIGTKRSRRQKEYKVPQEATPLSTHNTGSRMSG